MLLIGSKSGPCFFFDFSVCESCLASKSDLAVPNRAWFSNSPSSFPDYVSLAGFGNIFGFHDPNVPKIQHFGILFDTIDPPQISM